MLTHIWPATAPVWDSGQAVGRPEPLVEGTQAYLPRPVLKDLEVRRRAAGRPLVRVVRQVENVNEAHRISAEIHENPDPPFRNVRHAPVNCSPTGKRARAASARLVPPRV